MKMCGCGCGLSVSHTRYTYRQGHEPLGSRTLKVKRKTCACGCGEVTTRKEYDYLAGHEGRPSLRQRMDSRTRIEDGCWVWTGSHIPRGYGTVWDGSAGRKRYAHHLSWEMFYGAIPDGLFVLHHCDNPPCWNPEHLFVGTQADNMADMSAKGRTSNQFLKRRAEVRPRSNEGADVHPQD